MDLISLASEHLACTVDPLGAELQSLTGRDGRQWLWDGDPHYWSGRAPILFPIVGMLAGGAFRWQGRRYALESMALPGAARSSWPRTTTAVRRFAWPPTMPRAPSIRSSSCSI